MIQTLLPASSKEKLREDSLSITSPQGSLVGRVRGCREEDVGAAQGNVQYLREGATYTLCAETRKVGNVPKQED